jgi:REP element-mobilizing transposase RayT
VLKDEVEMRFKEIILQVAAEHKWQIATMKVTPDQRAYLIKGLSKSNRVF